MTAPRFLVVDDEELARTRILQFLSQHYDPATLAEAEDGFDAIEKIKSHQPSIVFLDIEMPELNGFEVLRNIENRNFVVIFQTAFDEFAVKAFEVNACDYLLKPFDDQRLEQAIAKAKERLAASSDSPKQEDQLIDGYLADAQRYLDRFLVKVGNRTKVIMADEIRYFTSESHVTRIFLENIDYAYSNSLTHIEKQIDPRQFLRLHRNNIVKLDQIKTVHHGPNTTVELRDGTKLPVSRERKSRLKQVLEQQSRVQNIIVSPILLSSVATGVDYGCSDETSCSHHGWSWLYREPPLRAVSRCWVGSPLLG